MKMKTQKIGRCMLIGGDSRCGKESTKRENSWVDEMGYVWRGVKDKKIASSGLGH